MHDAERFQFNDKHFLPDENEREGEKKRKGESGKVKDDGNKNILIVVADTANDFSSTHFYFHPNQIHENIAKFIFMWGMLHCKRRREERGRKQGKGRRLSYFFITCCCRSKVRKVSFHYAGEGKHTLDSN
jgi:prolipoprotein diacylglyceryltransferase